MPLPGDVYPTSQSGNQSLKYTLDFSDSDFTTALAGSMNISLASFAVGTPYKFPRNARLLASRIDVVTLFDDGGGTLSLNFSLSVNPSIGNSANGGVIASAVHVGTGGTPVGTTGSIMRSPTFASLTTTGASANTDKVGGITPWVMFSAQPTLTAGKLKVECIYYILP